MRLTSALTFLIQPGRSRSTRRPDSDSVLSMMYRATAGLLERRALAQREEVYHAVSAPSAERTGDPTHDDPPQPQLVRAPHARRLHAPRVLTGRRVQRSRLRRPPGRRDRQLLVGAEQLQRPPPPGGGRRQARRVVGRRLPAGVPDDLARRRADEADDDDVPEPHGD